MTKVLRIFIDLYEFPAIEVTQFKYQVYHNVFRIVYVKFNCIYRPVGKWNFLVLFQFYVAIAIGK